MKIRFAILLLFVTSWLCAQNHYVFSPIDSNNGLSENRVRYITQLPDSRIIVMTDGVYNLYDGTSFRYIHFNDSNRYSLPNYSAFHRTYTDADGLLWIKEYRTLKIFDTNSEHFISNLNHILHKRGVTDSLTNYFMDNHGNAWFLTQKDELLLMRNGEKQASLFLSNISQQGMSGDDLLLDLAVHQTQIFLIYQSGAIHCFDLNTRNEIFRNNPIAHEKEGEYNQIAIATIHEESLFLIRNGNKGALLHYNIKSQQWETLLKTNYWIHALSFDLEGNIWLSCSQGLWLINKNLRDKQHIAQLPLIDGKIVETSINTHYSDNQGGIWLGTVNHGIFYYHPDRFKFKNIGKALFEQKDLHNLQINCFAEREKDLLIGTPNGLFCYSPSSPTLTLSTEVPYDIDCQSMLRDSQGNVWLCGGGGGVGLYRFNPAGAKHFQYSTGTTYYVYENPDSSLYLCLGTGLGQLNPQTGTYTQLESTRELSVVYQMAEYGQNALIGIADAGVFIYNRQKDSLYVCETFQKDRPEIFRQNNHRYNCIFTDHRGFTWFGTEDGLSVWNPKQKQLRIFHTEDGLINNRIQSITEDYAHRIWISTANGISLIRLTGDNEYAFHNYNHYDGVITNEFRERSVYITQSGSILWGGIDGFNEINLSRSNRNQQTLSKPLLVKFFLFGKEVKPQSAVSTQPIVLNYDQNFVSFDFSALNYINPTQTYYRYRLEGVDAIWNEIAATEGIGKISYTNLSPGTYTLRVYAANNDKVWSEDCATIQLTIHPPFWKTPLAYIFYLCVILSILYLISSYYLKQKKKRIEQEQKENLDKMKFRFFTNISHELRTPLSLILTPLDALLKKMEAGTQKEQLTGVYRNVNDLLKIVNQLLDFRKLEMTGETLHPSYCNIPEFVDWVATPFETLAQDKEITFTRTYSIKNLYAYIDKDKLQKIINNLLSNASKFTPQGGSIQLFLEKSTMPQTGATAFCIQVKDTGCGIPEKELPHIFTRFYQVKGNESPQAGSGIGLHLVHEYVQLHKGEIHVESQSKQGTTFSLYLPIQTSNKEVEQQAAPVYEAGNRPTLLIVEDNDEFRTFMSSQLSEQYTVIEATNGAEGLQKVQDLHPDLVISDVMMPEIDGMELCNRLKKEIETSHIPIIILTARSSDESQIEGYKSGADAYISKPFNMDILLLRISNLLEQQKERKDLFKKAIIIQPDSIATTSVDEKLITKAIQCVEQNLSNTLYSVEQLSKEMHMDRTGLYRKLLAITGQTPSAFIRSIRLKKAAQLLAQGLSVSEVADLVGFGTMSYFSKCFQEEFGVKPSAYSAH